MAHAANEGYPINRGSVARYFLVSQTLVILFAGIWFFGIGIVLAVLHAVLIAPWLTVKQAGALRYWREGNTLRVDQGVFFLKRKAIPLERITDVVLVQGPLMRWCGIWSLHVQTAGTGQAMPEATLYGVIDPELIRDELLAKRFGGTGQEGS